MPATFQGVLVSLDLLDPLKTISLADASPDESVANILGSDEILTALLIRPCEGVPGLYAHHLGVKMCDQPNTRATRLAMSCGLLSSRFYGTVVLHRSHS